MLLRCTRLRSIACGCLNKLIFSSVIRNCLNALNVFNDPAAELISLRGPISFPFIIDAFDPQLRSMLMPRKRSYRQLFFPGQSVCKPSRRLLISSKCLPATINTFGNYESRCLGFSARETVHHLTFENPQTKPNPSSSRPTESARARAQSISIHNNGEFPPLPARGRTHRLPPPSWQHWQRRRGGGAAGGTALGAAATAERAARACVRIFSGPRRGRMVV